MEYEFGLSRERETHEPKVQYTNADYQKLLLREQPFYRYGMTDDEARREMDYLNNHLPDFYNGTYVPLWKQNLFH